MSDDEIVGALRACSNSKGHRCSECHVFSRYDYRVCKKTVDKAAANLIERQQTHNEQQQTRIAELEQQLAASRRREQAAVEDLNGTGACFTCKHFRRNGGDCFGAGRCRLDGIEIWPCNEPGVYRVEVPDDGRKTYEWRGPQEAGEGAEE